MVEEKVIFELTLRPRHRLNRHTPGHIQSLCLVTEGAPQRFSCLQARTVY
jgi:hypothetical protein